MPKQNLTESMSDYLRDYLSDYLRDYLSDYQSENRPKGTCVARRRRRSPATVATVAGESVTEPVPGCYCPAPLATHQSKSDIQDRRNGF